MTPRNEPHQLAHKQHKVPVTSLEFYSDDLLLAGEGTHLNAYSTSQKIHLGSVQIFRSQAIHRILINQTTKEILVCGGSHVALIRLQNETKALVTFEILARRDVGDWIFNAAFPPLSENDSATIVALVTAHNALIKCTLERNCGDKSEHSLSAETVVPGSNCVLYCAHISWLSASVCLIASGTAFGDIIIWSTPFSAEKHEPTSVKTHYIFQAHEGSIFDVQISTHLEQDVLGGPDRVLASCSDDRTIRLWDISDLDRESPSMTDIQRETGFGSTDQSNTYAPPLLSSAAGHISRIWMVRFILESTIDEHGEPTGKVDPLAIASFGEDGSCITWNVSTVPDNGDRLTYELRQSRALPIHAGKNIWSATVRNGHGASGGADGMIALLPSIARSPQVFAIDDGLLYTSNSEDVWVEPKDVFRSYTFVGDGTVLATTTNGHIVTLTLEPDGCSIVTRYDAYESLSDFSMTTSGQGLAFIAGIKGDVLMFACRYDQCFDIGTLSRKVAGLFLSIPAASTNHYTAEGHDLLVTTVGSPTAQLIQIHKMTYADGAGEYDPVEQLLVLPPRFVATSFIFVQHGDVAHVGYAIVGSRSGALAVYDLTGPGAIGATTSTDLLQHCHGKESVTAFEWKPATRGDDALGYLWSTGRDGTCTVHQVTLQESSLSFELVHQLELPFGPNIEGLKFTLDGSLHVWGFKGKQFVVHDIIAQQDIFTVECGGGVHRNWAYEPVINGRTFIWTQNSTLMRVTQTERPLQTVRAGGHGREIKAVAVSAGQQQSIATGAEDTDIKLFTYSSGNGFKCLQTLRKHNTGIQHLQWSTDGRRLFSSAGSEEFHVWRVCHDVPALGVGVVCESAHPRSMASDLRITGFDARERASDEQQGSIFDIVMAYSDSTVKVWSYSQNKWTLEKSGNYLTACLTDVRYLSAKQDEPSDNYRLVTTATDGHIAMWHCSEIDMLAWLHRRRVHQNAILNATDDILSDGSPLLVTAGDDNGVGLSRIDAKNGVSTLLIPRAHAAAVTALAMYKYDDDCFYVLSASIDQRVKLWDICIDTTVAGVASLQVRKVQNVFTSVADVSSMALLRLEDDSTGVLVCGVGMDVWRLQDTPASACSQEPSTF
jgi:WD40 repeat protein